MKWHKFIAVAMTICLFYGHSFADEEGSVEVEEKTQENPEPAKIQTEEDAFDPMEGKLKIDVVYRPEDCPEKTTFGHVLHMKYAGYLKDGTKFDSSDDRNQLFIFELGAGQAIQGWEQGLHDMCVGEKRKLVIPPHLAYGDRGVAGVIPPNSTLYMDVELKEIREGKGEDKRTPQLFEAIDEDKNGELTQDEVSKYIKASAGDDEQFEADDHDTLVSEIFQSEDKDKDGVITFEEFSGPKHDEL